MALSLDGSGVVGNSALGSIPVALSTTSGSGQIIVCIGTNSPAITSVTASGLVFTIRKPYFACSGSLSGLAIYSAPYTSNFSGNITVVPSTSNFCSVNVFGIGGADTTAGLASPPFDPNGGLPVSQISGAGVAVGTTSNATDFVFSTATGTTAMTAGSGWTVIPGSGATGAFFITMYQIVAATGSYTPSTASGTINGNITDAIMQATPPPATNLMAQIWM